MPIAVDLDRLTRAPRLPVLDKILGDGLSTSCLSAASRPTRGSRIASCSPRSTSDMSTRPIGSSSLGVTMPWPNYYASIRSLVIRTDAVRTILSHRARARRGAGCLLPHGERVRVAERARGVLRSSCRGHGDGRPVLADAAGAVPETLGGAGISSRRRISSPRPRCGRASTTRRFAAGVFAASGNGWRILRPTDRSGAADACAGSSGVAACT